MRLFTLCPEFFGLLSRILTLFPIWVTVICFASPNHATPLHCYGLLLLCGMLPALLGRFTKIGQKRVLRGIVVCLCAVGCIFATRSGVGDVAAVSLSVVTAIFGGLASQKESDGLFDRATFVGYLTLETVSLILLAVVEISVSMPLAIVLTAYQSIAFLLLCNRYHLLRLVNRRCDGGMPVPTEILCSNRRLVIGIILGGAGIFLLGKPIIVLLQHLLDGGIALLVLLCKNIIALIRTMGGGAPAAPSDSTEDATPAPVPIAGSNPWWSLLYLLLIPMVVFIWRVLLRDFLGDLLGSLRQRMRRVQSRGQEAQINTHREYEDIETFCAAEDTVDRAALRSWKRACRKWKKMPDSEKKLQEGYRLVLCAPAWGGAQPLPSETPQEILQRGAQALPPVVHGRLEQFTADYQQVRYGGYALLPYMLKELAQLLTDVSHQP
ncbi:MAG: DUF4129 domain-containing protein [Oscillospiraceae bacterium]|nr:DUF4129 domain-containing protein [Oscillospiraceae bacterium]